MQTHGWDLVCGCSRTCLNKSLAAQAADFGASRLHYDDKGGTTVDATFGPFEIVPGGGGTKLHIKVPVTSGSLAGNWSGADISGVEPIFEVELGYFDDASGNRRELRFALSSPAETPVGTPHPGFAIVNADPTGALTGRDGGEEAKTVLGDVLPACLAANADAMAYVLSTLDKTPSGPDSWAKPAHVDYFYKDETRAADGSVETEGYVVVLTQIEGDAPERGIDASIFASKHDVCLGVDASRFLYYLVLPKLEASVTGISALVGGTSRSVIDNTLTLANVELNQPIEGVKVVFGFLTITLKGDHFHAQAIGFAPIPGHEGSTASFTFDQDLSCAFDPSADNFAVIPRGRPETTLDLDLSFADKILFGLATIFTFGSVTAQLEAMEQTMAEETIDMAMQFEMRDWIVQPVAWGGTADWKVREGGLADIFYVRFDLP